MEVNKKEAAAEEKLVDEVTQRQIDNNDVCVLVIDDPGSAGYQKAKGLVEGQLGEFLDEACDKQRSIVEVSYCRFDICYIY